MKVVAEYNSSGLSNNYRNFICELDRDTLLKIEIIDKNKCNIKMEDKISGITEICSTISNDDLNAIIKVFRNVSFEMQKINDENENCKSPYQSNGIFVTAECDK